MPKQRDYRAEYRRRIQAGLAKGYTRSQAAGHPKPGETPVSALSFHNPFSEMRDSIRTFMTNFQNILGGEPSGLKGTPNEIEYIRGGGETGWAAAPRWTIGTELNPISVEDFKELLTEVRDKRFQNEYAMIVCGYLEETYPGHEEDGGVECLSYRIRLSIIRKGLNMHPENMTEMVNSILPENHTEQWVSVTEVQFIDKV